MEPIIKGTELKKEFSSGKTKVLAVKDVSIEINKGDKIAITGPSGCGKTTLLNILGLVVKPTSGTVTINSKNTENLSEKELATHRNKVFGYVVQEFALIEEYTVFENIEIPLMYSSDKYSKKKKKEVITDVLKKVDLSVKVNEKAKNLSGGQRQRVAIARAIVNDPQIILADEPTGSLDSQTGEEILKILNSLVKQRKTLVLVTHDHSLAQKCDKQIKMSDGEIVG
ncbi:ABC transporter ATP-binding protein [Proteinivorax tanatarense]|uniref:ABC transporter ATP-binding protein n=1 Tax=Proteinivorax tanatarense TaxID=1260629 RepID=A0AAU7VNQ1_9FIRM